ncbi:MAG TPA: hypothetical protein VFG46_27975 [Chryseolinea sp.]|nr:hypothetical protein [Chryseolinea sp.]
MENFNFIEFHRTRDFSRKLNATFEFVKQNFKPLGKSILLIAGPPVLLASLVSGSFMSEFMNFSSMSGNNPAEQMQNYFTSVSFWLQIVLMIVFFTISGVMNIATINNYLLLYEKKRTNKIEVSEVWERVRATFWMYFSTMFLFMIMVIAAYLVLLIPIGILAAISPLLIFFGVLFLMCGILYFFFGAALVFIIRAYEKKGFFDAVGRSFKLVKDKWWSTFGLIMVLYLIVGVSSYIFLIPWYAITVVTALHNTSVDTFQEPSMGMQSVTIVLFTLYYLAQMILTALPNVGTAFQYFNLVELKEAKGLMAEIQTLGQSQSQVSPEDEHF